VAVVAAAPSATDLVVALEAVSAELLEKALVQVLVPERARVPDTRDGLI
jgi:hypothetical protein